MQPGRKMKATDQCLSFDLVSEKKNNGHYQGQLICASQKIYHWNQGCCSGCFTNVSNTSIPLQRKYKLSNERRTFLAGAGQSGCHAQFFMSHQFKQIQTDIVKIEQAMTRFVQQSFDARQLNYCMI